MGKALPSGVAASHLLYFKYRIRSKKDNVAFTLSLEEFLNITSKNCSYCNKAPLQVFSNIRYNGVYNYNGVDRVDSSIGYILSNCIPCCKTCNFMKRKHSQQEFIAHIQAILVHFKDDKNT